MKKYGKLLKRIGLVVLMVSLFLNLSLSDVLRINPQLKGVPTLELVSTAKETTVDERVSVLVSEDELPEEPSVAEATEEWSVDGHAELDVNGDGEPDGFLLTYEKFAALGGRFLKDKYGEIKFVEVEDVRYAQGFVNNKGILWQHLSLPSRTLCVLAVTYLPLVILGAAMLLLGLLLTAAFFGMDVLLCASPLLLLPEGILLVWSFVKR